MTGEKSRRPSKQPHIFQKKEYVGHRPPRTIDMKVEFAQQSTGTTVGEMKRTISEYFQNDRQGCTFKITVYLLPHAM